MFRTIEQSFALIKKADTGSAITRYRIRMLLASGQVRTLKVGKKTLVDCISLQEFLGMELINVTRDVNDGKNRPDFEAPENGERRK